MDWRRLDEAAQIFAASGTRRGLLQLLASLPLAGAVATLMPGESEARSERHHRDGMHQKRRHAEAQGRHKRKRPKKRCIPESVAETCAGKCATVNNNCGTAVDCGACNCGSCQICQTCDAATGRCVANGSVVGQVCSSCHTCSVAGLCENAPDGIACNDGDACTQIDTCQGGVCVGSNPVVCTSSDACHVAGTCNPATGACSNPIAPNQTICAGSGTDTSICCNGACCDGCCDANGDCGDCMVFVTTQSSDGRIAEPGGLVGMAAADVRCQRLATNRTSLPPLPGTYKAWLSTGNGAGENPLTRFRHSRKPYRLPDVASSKIADDWDDLVTCDGSFSACLDHFIDVTENGDTSVIGAAWTNTSQTGADAVFDCDDWTSASAGNGTRGQTNLENSSWTFVNSISCSEPHRLYCFQQS